MTKEYTDKFWEGLFSKRDKIVKKFQNKDPNFFKIQDYLDLSRFSTYVFITPRSIGKTYSGWEICINAYITTGEYTVWMRTKDEEVKNIVDDYKRNRPEAWPDWAEVKGRSLIDNRTGNLICKFVGLSTVGNFASITGDGCFMIYYDEFLPRGGRPVKNAYNVLTDFIKTLERGHLLTVILSANLTTLNSDILNQLDLWTDEPELDDESRRLRYRLLTEWENPPVTETISTAAMWASNNENLENFMFNNTVLDTESAEVIPVSRVGSLRYVEMYMIEGVEMTLALDDDGNFVLVKGRKVSYENGGVVYDLTTEDGYKPSHGHIRPFSVNETLANVMYALENNALTFTDFETKDLMIRLLISLRGKITNR